VKRSNTPAATQDQPAARRFWEDASRWPKSSPRRRRATTGYIVWWQPYAGCVKDDPKSWERVREWLTRRGVQIIVG
jgi:hypothetical protein